MNLTFKTLTNGLATATAFLEGNPTVTVLTGFILFVIEFAKLTS